MYTKLKILSMCFEWVPNSTHLEMQIRKSINQNNNFIHFFPLLFANRIIQPQCLGGLVTYFTPGGDKEISTNDAYLFAAGIVICSLFSITVFHPFILYAFQLGMRVRLTCCSLIYKKVISSLIHENNLWAS